MKRSKLRQRLDKKNELLGLLRWRVGCLIEELEAQLEENRAIKLQLNDALEAATAAENVRLEGIRQLGQLRPSRLFRR